MIKKLETQEIEQSTGSEYTIIERVPATSEQMHDKINELVDTVNGILAAQEQYATIYNEDIVPMLTPKNEEPADPYAEQRKWVGCLCWFWDGNSNRQFGILTDINKNDEYIFIRNRSDMWKHCEPVKPGSDIIYKGDDNISKDELVFRLEKTRERDEILYGCLKIATCALKQIRGNGVTSTPWQQDAEKALSFIDKYYGIENLITKGGDNE